ncbi:MAG: NUDIX hydrolase N-terminal domain-containing protein [Candidatus Rickettsiella isopodorum]
MNYNYGWLRIAEQIKSISQNGLTFCNNLYDKKRYQQLQNIAADIISNHSNFSQEKILDIFSNAQGYLTSKLDVEPQFLTKIKSYKSY